MSPFEFSILIHYHVSPCEYDGSASTDAIESVVDHLLGAGLLEVRSEGDRAYGGRYRTTRKGQFWIDHVLSTPYPVGEWRIPVREADRNPTSQQ